jgi:two-component system, NarL family, sensor histidine kinase UhpB
MLRRILTRLKRTPIFYRIAIGNAAIIVLAAMVGTILTRYLANITSTLWHFILFASVGIVISLALNIFILQVSLQPLSDLRQTVNRLQANRLAVDQLLLNDTDPDVYQLTKALNSLLTELETSNQQLRMLSERAINAQEEERKRIARSLHDDIGQSLSSLIINLERLESHQPIDKGEIIERLSNLRKMAAESLDDLRSIIYDLRPAILDDLGLLPAIRWFARTNLEEAGIQVELDFPEAMPSYLPQPLTTTLFRITQEGVNNIIRHSQAKKACIELGWKENEVYLKISDDGHGFDPTQINTEAIHLQRWGLIGIQERIELVRGRMSIQSDPQHGTTLIVTFPLQGYGVKQDG